MPGVTPYFNLPYRCLGETVSNADFDALANAIDTALTAIYTNEQAVRKPPMVKVLRNTGSQNVTVNTDTNMNFTSALYDSVGSMWAVGVPADVVVPSDGVYFAMARMALLAGFTTFTSNRLTLLFNNTARYSKKIINNGSCSVFGIYPLSSGQTVRLRDRWTGTGGPAAAALVGTSNYEMSVYKLCNL